MELALSGPHPRLLPHLLSPQRPRLLLPNPGHGPQALHPSQPDATPTREDPEASPSPCARPRRPSGLPLFLGAPPPARETPAPYPSPPVCPSRPRCSALPPTTRGIRGLLCPFTVCPPGHRSHALYPWRRLGRRPAHGPPLAYCRAGGCMLAWAPSSGGCAQVSPAEPVPLMRPQKSG